MRPKRRAVRRLRRICSIASCRRPIRVLVYADGSYRGGHYFGRLLGRGLKGEYWECPRCYWGKGEQSEQT